MDDDSRMGGVVKTGLAAVGLGGVVAAVALPRPYGLWVGLAILVLFLLLFGGYYLWRRYRARRQRERFSAAIEAQTSKAPVAISDPNQRAALDKLRQKFQKGMQEFKSRGKDIYKLPWYVIMGEPGSGKSEAIRHSGVEFPPGLQDELQGSGGTVNMDWWFTNRGIILDTAGSMIFNESRAGEAPEWREFLRLLKKARPRCPINGLFLVLSVESLIRDSAETIAQKAGRLAQQLQLIQSNLDVRFPVYLLVTKCDLLTGFREFFDSIEDPLLQSQVFGWSNAEPLDAHFRPDLVDQHLNGIAQRLCRRRLALLRDSSAAGRSPDTTHFYTRTYQGAKPAVRRLDEVDALFALPESILRLGPRLRRYLETIFVAGEWSAKPVFLRGIYFTSSMREGKALDEAIAFATGLPLDQLPEDRRWERNRAFFLRDLFLEKVFRESGLVTRATNTRKLLRQRKLAIFGTAGCLLLLLLVFAGFGYKKLDTDVNAQAAEWQAGAAILKQGQGEWSPAIVTPAPLGESRSSYSGTNLVPGTALNLIQYHAKLRQHVETKLATGLFTPMAWLGLGEVKYRPEAQRDLFEASVVRPLVLQTRVRMQRDIPAAQDAAAVNRHRDALLALMQFESDAIRGGALVGTNALARAETYLRSFLSYLTGQSFQPDTNWTAVFAWTYSKQGWPPQSLLLPDGAKHLTNNPPIKIGLENFAKVNRQVQSGISNDVNSVDQLVEALEEYVAEESKWLQNPTAACPLPPSLDNAMRRAEEHWRTVTDAAGRDKARFTSLASRYDKLRAAATSASASAFTNIVLPAGGESGLFAEISDQIKKFTREAGAIVNPAFETRGRELDTNCVAAVGTSDTPAFQLRWSLYTQACGLASNSVQAQDFDVGARWTNYERHVDSARKFSSNLTNYNGAFQDAVKQVSSRIASDAEVKLKERFVQSYVDVVTKKLNALKAFISSDDEVGAARDWLDRLSADLEAGRAIPEVEKQLVRLRKDLPQTKQEVLVAVQNYVQGQLGPPIVAGPGPDMTAAKLLAARTTIQSVQSVLGHGVWKNPAGGDPAAPVLDKVKAWDRILAVVLDRDKVADCDITIPPYSELNEKDQGAVSTVRYVRVSPGSKVEDLSRPENPLLWKAPLDQSVTLSFSQQSTGPALPAVMLESWWLPRRIRDARAQSLDGGKKWRIKIPLPGTAGNAVFDASLVNGQSLPPKELWP